MTSRAILAHLQRRMAAHRSAPLAIVATDGVWLDGALLTLEAYTQEYAGRAREELRVEGLSLGDLE